MLGSRQGAAAEEAPLAPRTLIVVRHAEKAVDSDDPKNPGLDERGIERAAALARLLANAGVTHLWATEYRRTQESLAPLGHAAEVEVTIREARDVEGTARHLSTLPAASVVVVAGHSNTVPALVRALGGSIDRLDEAGNLGEHEYDRLFLLTLTSTAEGNVRALGTLELQYGA